MLLLVYITMQHLPQTKAYISWSLDPLFFYMIKKWICLPPPWQVSLQFSTLPLHTTYPVVSIDDDVFRSKKCQEAIHSYSHSHSSSGAERCQCYDPIFQDNYFPIIYLNFPFFEVVKKGEDLRNISACSHVLITTLSFKF